MPQSVDAESLQHRKPHVAQWRVLRQDEMLAQFQVGSAAGENGRAIGQVVNGADVRSEGHGGVVEEARPSASFVALSLSIRRASSSL